MLPPKITLFQYCATVGGSELEILHCLSDRFEEAKYNNARYQSSMNQWLFVFSGAMVFVMQAGFAMVCAGCVRKKNLHNTVLKNLLDICGAAAAFYTIGYGLAFGGQDDDNDVSFMGTKNFFGTGDIDVAYWFFQFVLSATAVTIVAGTLAERCKMAAYLWYSLFLTGFVYPITAHTLWSHKGLLSVSCSKPFRGVGVIDFAGSGVIHLAGGSIALAATYILGPRKGRFYDLEGKALEKPTVFPGHSIALQLLGTLVLWFGWYGFNGGSSLLLVNNTVPLGGIAARAVANTALAGAAGAISALVTNLYLEYRKTNFVSFNLGMAMNGALSGLVSITAGCGTAQLYSAFITGIIAGWLYILGFNLLIRFKLDDVVNGIPVHMLNGAWGLIATGLFSEPKNMMAAYGNDDHVGLFYEFARGRLDGTLLGNQIIGVLFISGWTMTTTIPFFLLLNHLGLLRSDGLEEVVGLDLRYHGEANEAEHEIEEDVRRYQEQMKEAKNIDDNKCKPLLSVADTHQHLTFNAVAESLGQNI